MAGVVVNPIQIKESVGATRQTADTRQIQSDLTHSPGARMQAIHVCNHTTPEALYPFDARGIAKRFRHAAIFGALDA
jgi:hypothetical protein